MGKHKFVDIQQAANHITTAEWLLPVVAEHIGCYARCAIDAARAVNADGGIIRASEMGWHARESGQIVSALLELQNRINVLHNRGIQLVQDMGLDLPVPDILEPSPQSGGR